MKNKTILLISPEAWGTNFVSKHHYANYLAKHNTVYFLNPVTSSIINPFGNVNVKIEKIKNNLHQINYQNLVPRLNTLPKFVQQYIFKKQAQQIQKALNIKKFNIVWSFDPYRFWNQNVWTAEKTIYHAVDDHTSKYENITALSSCMTIIVSNYLRKKFNGVNLKYISHGSCLTTDKNDKFIMLPGENKIKIGFVGNFLSSNIDYKHLKEITESLSSEIDLICIGPHIESTNLGGNKSNTVLKNIKELKQNKNVYFIGEIPSLKINSYLSSFDINLIVYTKFEKNVAPHKLLQYLNAGKVIVSSFLYDYDNSEMICFVQNNSNLKKTITEIIKDLNHYNSTELQQKRKQFAIQNSYDKKIEEISKLLYDNN